MLFPVVLGTSSLYAECLRITPSHPPPRTGVVYISGCSEGKTNGILHKYSPLQPPSSVTTKPSSFFSPPLACPLSLSLSLALTVAIFQQKTSRFANVSSREMVDADRQMDRVKRAKGKSQECRSGHHFRDAQEFCQLGDSWNIRFRLLNLI